MTSRRRSLADEGPEARPHILQAWRTRASEGGTRDDGLDMGKTRPPLKIGGALIHEDREEIRLELEKIGKIKPRPRRRTGLAALESSSKTSEYRRMRSGKGYVSRRPCRLRPKHVKTELYGRKRSSVAKAFAAQLTHPRHGFEALTVILEPNLTVRPASLIVPTVRLRNLRQANMFYGPSQSAIAKAVADGIESKIIPNQR